MQSPGSSIAVLARRKTLPEEQPPPESEEDNENIPIVIVDVDSEEEPIRSRLKELLRLPVG